ncbi:MAG: family 16 glycosylhydrolase [Bacteroidota bacterium]|nr:family 16 glycosylhydrolase [Bacteroidota bacterium]
MERQFFNYGANDSIGFANIEASHKWVFIESFGNHQWDSANSCNNYYTEFGENIIFDANGICKLEANKNSGTYPYPCDGCWTVSGGGGQKSHHNFNTTGGQLITQQAFKYGAFELKFRWPDINLYGTTVGVGNNELVRGMFPAFWMFPHSPSMPDNMHYYEIDYFETAPQRYNLCGATIHRDTLTNSNSRTIDQKYSGITEASAYKITDFAAGKYHVVTGEWNPDYIDIFVDGKMVLSFNWEQDQLVPMNVYISIGGQTKAPNEQTHCTTSNTLTPYNMDIDYFKIYKLDTSNMTTVTVLNNYVWAGYGHWVKKSITIGGPGGNNDIVPANTKVALRLQILYCWEMGLNAVPMLIFMLWCKKLNKKTLNKQ